LYPKNKSSFFQKEVDQCKAKVNELMQPDISATKKELSQLRWKHIGIGTGIGVGVGLVILAISAIANKSRNKDK